MIDALDDEGKPVVLRVESIAADPRDAAGEVHLYGLSLQRGQAWVPYCAPDIDGRRAAIPVGGAWAASGEPIDAGADALTFACTSGAIGKCLRLGYAPWRKVDGGPSLARLHSACVRMIRADYCGDGKSHTVDGTVIDIADVRNIQKLEPSNAGAEVLEAGWSENGATYLDVPRLNDDVAAIVRECPKKLAHRSSLDAKLAPDAVVQRFPETLLVDMRARKTSPGSLSSPPARPVESSPGAR
ncbi:MAG: hypothetical protein JST54_34240 [Deltaproteobacteria bacterium]|nr:hypothetical protein [Deltaproteobacteria bacterium]